jgi:hypothetical protein
MGFAATGERCRTCMLTVSDRLVRLGQVGQVRIRLRKMLRVLFPVDAMLLKSLQVLRLSKEILFIRRMNCLPRNLP